MFFLPIYIFLTFTTGEKNTPKSNKEYLWNHWTDSDHVNIIRREISSRFLLFKNSLKNIFIYVYFLNTKKYNFY